MTIANKTIHNYVKLDKHFSQHYTTPYTTVTHNTSATLHTTLHNSLQRFTHPYNILLNSTTLLHNFYKHFAQLTTPYTIVKHFYTTLNANSTQLYTTLHKSAQLNTTSHIAQHNIHTTFFFYKTYTNGQTHYKTSLHLTIYSIQPLTCSNRNSTQCFNTLQNKTQAQLYVCIRNFSRTIHNFCTTCTNQNLDNLLQIYQVHTTLSKLTTLQHSTQLYNTLHDFYITLHNFNTIAQHATISTEFNMLYRAL